MAQHEALYQRAVYYDVALRRDVAPDVAFLLDVYARHHGGRPQTALEVACGPGYHARALARCGLSALGLDLYAPMLELARAQAAAEGVAVDWLVADMRRFQLPRPVDLACCLFDGIDALVDDDDVVTHFQAVAANLAPGGLYVVDCTHPRICSYAHYGDYRYEGRREGLHVVIDWATNAPAIDPATGVADVEVVLRVEEEGAAVQEIRNSARERCFTAPELRLLARLSGVFRVVGWYGAYRIDQPLDTSPEADRMIAVFQTQAAPA